MLEPGGIHVMTRDQIRDQVRRAVERRLGIQPPVGNVEPVMTHPSHQRFPIAADEGPTRACVIEPGARCVGCGYCRSYGH
ncbi:MAG TPA: hypothetical protein DCP38_02690 [Acidobacteria bacterium]|nr:hypothetical protein [Acidobacteriota bacterium]HAK54382.1 hypothetical protein [Acidobacteriota bacterium]